MYRELYDASLVVFAVVEEVTMEVPSTLLARLAENGIVVAVVRAWDAKGVDTHA